MQNIPKIVLPEGEDSRIREASRHLMANGQAHPVIIGNVDVITAELGDSTGYTAVSRETDQDVIWQAAEMVQSGQADGVVAGATHTSAEVLRAYFKTIGLRDGVSRAASCFVMQKDDKKFIFADCAVNIEPSVETLAETAFLCHEFAPQVGITPKIAFLSFSTRGSAAHEAVDKVRNASELAKERYPELVVDGEMQIDTALIPSIAQSKTPDSSLQGDATVFIFPNLDAGNIAYKITERLAGFQAIGPIMLGLAKPAHDLSRGCTVDDIVKVVEITAKQSLMQNSG